MVLFHVHIILHMQPSSCYKRTIYIYTPRLTREHTEVDKGVKKWVTRSTQRLTRE